ncbi:MAG: hypothetical protein KAS12_00140 [Candidatus Aenigmarchaeota archaeon]|nr:hypothetical protein [Candidatus Aenigmarchaeota archaeon]
MSSTNDIKVLIILLKNITVFSRIKSYARLESSQLVRSLNKLIMLKAVIKNGKKKNITYTITDEGKQLLKDTLTDKHKEYVEKAKYYELLMNKITI